MTNERVEQVIENPEPVKEKRRVGRPRSYNVTKPKFTFYIRPEIEKKFCEIHAYNVLMRNKKTKSDIMCEAIDLAYAKYFRARQRERARVEKGA